MTGFEIMILARLMAYLMLASIPVTIVSYMLTVYVQPRYKWYITGASHLLWIYV